MLAYKMSTGDTGSVMSLLDECVELCDMALSSEASLESRVLEQLEESCGNILADLTHWASVFQECGSMRAILTYELVLLDFWADGSLGAQVLASLRRVAGRFIYLSMF